MVPGSAISQIITSTLESLGMKQPTPTVDLAEIRRKFHSATERAKSSARKSAA